MSSNRRDFIKFVVAGAIAAGCPLDEALLAVPAGPTPDVDGEDNTICHQVRDGHHFGAPPISGRHDVIIVGGGPSGLTAAYLLRGKDVLVLEKEGHWGGNAYMEEFQGNAYSTAAAFVDSPPAAELAREIGLEPLPIDNWDGTIVKGEFIPDTWGEGLDHLPYPASVRESFKKFRSAILAIDLKKREHELDNTSFLKFLHGYAPEVKQWWDGYGPSNWGTLAAETSALVAVDELQGIAGEDRKDDRSTWPGGLGALSKRLADVLEPQYKERMLRGATVIKVEPGRNEVHVTYMYERKLQRVAAKAVIMASPKFITCRIVEGIPARQLAAMKQIRYAPYPVVNLMYDKMVFNKGYDNWCPGNTFTDFIVADWTIRNNPGYKPKYNILTFYTPLRESERSTLLETDDCKVLAAKVLKDFQGLLPEFNVDPVEIRIYRRGHPMFMAVPGQYTKNRMIASNPMDRIFFGNSDSGGPESLTSEAVRISHAGVEWANLTLAGKPGARELAHKALTEVVL